MTQVGSLGVYDGAKWVELPGVATGQVLRSAGVGVVPTYGRVSLTHVIHGNAGADLTWTNMPLAATLLSGSTRHIRKLDLTNYTQCRLTMTKGSVAGAAASKLMLRYHTAWSSTVGDYVDIGTSEVSLAASGGIDGLVSAWIDLVSGAKGDVWVAMVGSGGDGALDPTFGAISAEFR